MSVDVRELGRQAVPNVGTDVGLEGMVAPVSDTLDLIDGGELRESRIIGPQLVLGASAGRRTQRRGGRLVNIPDYQQPPAQIPHISDLKDSRTAELILNVQTVILAIRIFEILADREHAIGRWGRGGAPENKLIGHDGVIRPSD